MLGGHGGNVDGVFTRFRGGVQHRICYHPRSNIHGFVNWKYTHKSSAGNILLLGCGWNNTMAGRYITAEPDQLICFQYDNDHSHAARDSPS